MIEKILFPVDFSPASAAMSAYVKRTATMFGSQVTLVYVCDPASHNGFELYLRSPQEISEEHWNIATDKMDSFLPSDFPLTECPRVVRAGEAAAQIADFARTGEFDLIVMPKHGGRFRQMLLGSTTAKVLNEAACPVMTTEHAEGTVPRSLEHRHLACALGLSANSERVLRLASRAATQLGAKLSVIHVIRGETDDEARMARRRLEQLEETVGSEATIRIASGPVKEALLGEARRFAADALIIGRTSRASGPPHRLGGLVLGVIRDSPVPVLSV